MIGEPAKPDYRISHVLKVKRQISDLGAKAKLIGSQQGLIDALAQVYENLRILPLEWGDPLRKTRKKGGRICRGLLKPLLNVEYAVFESERAVFVLDVRPLPGHFE